MPPVKSLKTNEGGVLVSLIEKDNNRYLVIVNCDYLNPAQLTLTVDGNAVSKVLKGGIIVRTDSETIKMKVDAGDVVIYRWEK
jgi:ethanolamine utilization protein EutQ (cupin superfamily)